MSQLDPPSEQNAGPHQWTGILLFWEYKGAAFGGVQGQSPSLAPLQIGESAENEGFRFSRCDASPSFTSGLSNPRNSIAKDASKIGPA